VHLWDTAGGEQHAGLGDGYYVGADAVLVVYDVNSQSSWDSVPGWIAKVQKMVPNVKVTLCGNKVDMGTRAVSVSAVKAYVMAHGYTHFDVSAKTCYNFERVLGCVE
jgi:small GTP-binding protein